MPKASVGKNSTANKMASVTSMRGQGSHLKPQPLPLAPYKQKRESNGQALISLKFPQLSQPITKLGRDTTFGGTLPNLLEHMELRIIEVLEGILIIWKMHRPCNII